MTVRAWMVAETSDGHRGVAQRSLNAPELPQNGAVVGITHAALGFPDHLLAEGTYHDSPQLPFVLGGEAAGIVEAVGRTSGLRIGDRVIVAPGRSVVGRLCERVAVADDLLLPIPTEMSLEAASAFFIAYQTAYIGLVRRARLAKGETLLVFGASGGVGMASIQVGRALGSQIIAVVGSQAKVAAATDAGAHHVVDRSKVDVTEAVKDLLGGRAVDVVLDPVGGEAFKVATRVIGVEGRILVAGFASGEIPKLAVNQALINNFAVIGFRTRPFRDDPSYRYQVHERLIDWFRAGYLSPRIELVAFNQVPEALKRISRGRVIGRQVIRVSADLDEGLPERVRAKS